MVTAAPTAQPTPVAQPAPAAVMSAPTPPPTPAAPKVDNQPAAPVASAVQQNASQQQTTNTKNMPKQLIPEELNELIQEYLTDGVLTDKERQVILRKAEGMGLDRDEIDLYLDAQVQKIDQAADAAVRRQKGKTCPYCGGSIPQLTDKCPHCGESITAEASKELEEILNNLEEALIDLKSGKDISKSKAIVERYTRKANLYFSSNPKIQKLLEKIEFETKDAEKKAISQARKKTLLTLLTKKKNIAIIAVVILALVFMKPWSKGAETIKSEATELIQNGKLDDAKNLLQKEDGVGTFEDFWDGGDSFLQQYDATYLMLIKSYIDKDDLNNAEDVAVIFKTKLGNDLSWKNSSCYKYLKTLYQQKGRDFSPLKSHWDSE